MQLRVCIWTRRTLRDGMHIFVLAALLLLQPWCTAVSISLEAEAAETRIWLGHRVARLTGRTRCSAMATMHPMVKPLDRICIGSWSTMDSAVGGKIRRMPIRMPRHMQQQLLHLQYSNSPAAMACTVDVPVAHQDDRVAEAADAIGHAIGDIPEVVLQGSTRSIVPTSEEVSVAEVTASDPISANPTPSVLTSAQPGTSVTPRPRPSETARMKRLRRAKPSMLMTCKQAWHMQTYSEYHNQEQSVKISSGNMTQQQA